MSDLKQKEPKMISMVASELIRWCKERKESLNLSNQKLAELSGVPQGTIDRILSGGYMEFRYSSIQPVVSVLVGMTESIPQPDDVDDQYYSDTIAGFRLIVDEKNKEIEQLRAIHQSDAKEIDFLREQLANIQGTMKSQQDHCIWMQSMIDDLKKK